ncbi:unnamed protein product [Fusarium graminearum]|nr:unnamed protein product [Fusarium graminearum]
MAFCIINEELSDHSRVQAFDRSSEYPGLIRRIITQRSDKSCRGINIGALGWINDNGYSSVECEGGTLSPGE